MSGYFGDQVSQDEIAATGWLDTATSVICWTVICMSPDVLRFDYYSWP